MGKLTRNHTFQRKIILEGICDDGTDAEFLVTFNSFPDEELHTMLMNTAVGSAPEDQASQRAMLDKVIKAATCKQLDPADDARDFLVNGTMQVRTAVRVAYTNSVYQGSLLQKN